MVLYFQQFPTMNDLLQKALAFLKLSVNAFAGSEVIEPANIAALNDGDNFLNVSHPVVMSVVNIEQDFLARSPHIYEKVPVVNEIVKYTNPTQHLTISLLFAAYAKEQKEVNYMEGMRKLETVIRFFQNNTVFNVEGNKLILSMQSLSMSELNQLWSMLGSKYMPSVMYKMRMIPIQVDAEDGGPPIEEIKIQLWEDEKNDPAGFLEEQIITT